MSSHEEDLQKFLAEEAYNAQLHGITVNNFIDRLQKPFEEGCEVSLIELEKTLIENGEDEEKVAKAFMDEIRPRLFGFLIENSAKTDGLTENPGKINEKFLSLLTYIHMRCFHVPAHVLLPEDACHSRSPGRSLSTTLARNRTLYNGILQEKQISSHLDNRLAELKKLKERLTN